MEAVKIPKFLTCEEGGPIWEKSNYAIAFLIPKVQMVFGSIFFVAGLRAAL